MSVSCFLENCCVPCSCFLGFEQLVSYYWIRTSFLDQARPHPAHWNVFWIRRVCRILFLKLETSHGLLQLIGHPPRRPPLASSSSKLTDCHSFKTNSHFKLTNAITLIYNLLKALDYSTCQANWLAYQLFTFFGKISSRSSPAFQRNTSYQKTRWDSWPALPASCDIE